MNKCKYQLTLRSRTTIEFLTRMHSSRMHTGRTLTIKWGVPAQEGSCLWVYLPGGVPVHGWCTCLGVYLPGGTCPGCTCLGYLLGGCTCQGVYLPGGWTMWPIPSCIWCYLYAVLTPTESQHLCSCLYSAGWSCDLWCMLGYHPPPPEQKHRHL